MRQREAFLAKASTLIHTSPLSRFGKALIVALAIHSVLAARWLVGAPTAPAPLAKTSATDLQVELERVAPRLSAGVTDTPLTAEPVAAERSATASVAVRLPVTRTVSSATAMQPPRTCAMLAGDSERADATAAARQPEPAARPVPSIDLGLDGRLFRARLSDVPEKPSTRRDIGAKLEHSLNASLAADDVKLGRARGNVLVGSLNSAVRTSGPASGDAIIRVTINSVGELSGLELLRGTTNDWASALQSFREQAKRNHVRVPTGAQGLRITFNVSTKVQRPSGKEVESSALGVKRPSLAPNGLTFLGDFDVADLSNKTSRMVYSRVLTEEVL